MTCDTWRWLGCGWAGLTVIVIGVVIFVGLAWITQRGQR